MPDYHCQEPSDQTTQASSQLAAALSLAPTSDLRRIGMALPGGSGNAYGGSLLAHMIHTSVESVDADRELQSIHAHFHAAGSVDEPVNYSRAPLQRTRRFDTFRVDASQQKGIFASGTISLHADEDTSEHSATVSSEWSAPEGSKPAQGDMCPLPTAPIRTPFEIRHARRLDQAPNCELPTLGLWVRTVQPLAGWREIHKAALAWVSDFSLTRAANLGHEQEPGRWFAASLNHAMWFHRPVDLNDWVLYELESPHYRGGIALSTGRFFTRDGAFLASVAQHCVVRRLADPNATGQADGK